ncbi:hypothetical protein [Amycolatopsis sp. YIM 10]|uniref:hypothetical protein n=1 Tax=Amycolatopsis sp. YIM 10 TaxID=2653857 RepID=UPI001D15808D|nr:hypothetical protein [Amycolatopsis sp. YIM 10]
MTEEVMARIVAAIELSVSGAREAARERFTELWAETMDPLHRCMIAHHLADQQDDVHEELRWDLVALELASSITDERATEVGAIGPVRSFYPSLHLNVGDAYRRLGELSLARHHLDLGFAAVGTLNDDEYGRLVKTGLARLAHELESA